MHQYVFAHVLYKFHVHLHVVFAKKVYIGIWPTIGTASEHKCSLPFDLQCGRAY